MLTHIAIRNFAIVEQLDLDLATGFTVITGETGAGKSIIVDAIGFALGDRADAQAIGPHADRAEVTVSFDVSEAPNAQTWLTEHELANDQGECILRRVVGNEGRSRAFINGQSAPVQQLKELGETLLDIHGQHEHQSLLKREQHSIVLDDYAGKSDLAAQVKQLYQEWRRHRDEFERLQSSTRETTTRREFLQFQLDELASLGLRDNELSELDAEHRRLSHVDKLVRGSELALTALDESDSAITTQVGKLVTELQQLASFDARLHPVGELLNNAQIAMQEATHELRNYLTSLEIEPKQLEKIETRLGAIHQLARKHRITPEELPALWQQLQTEWQSLEGGDERLVQLPKLIADLLVRWSQAAQKLSSERYSHGQKLSREIETTIKTLGMPQARFQVALQPNGNTEPSAWGKEKVEFLVSANLGYSPAPLTKIASGGELSRISLAIQVATSQSSRIPTMIFDEVDVGVGGSVAEAVGKEIRFLGDRRQVFCITHQPQVAALGHQHLKVSKTAVDNTTRTEMTLLSDKERSEEIARMLGGAEITKQTRAHAKEMLRRGQLA